MDKNILKKQDNTYKLIITPELEEKIMRLEPWSIGNYKNDNSRKSAVDLYAFSDAAAEGSR